MTFHSPEAVFQYLEDFMNLERGGFHPREYRLERMERLLSDFGNPHLDYKVVHVAGSKGKGSVCTFIAHCIRECGFSVGLYLSPHVTSYRERIQVLTGREDFDEGDLIVQVGHEIARYVDKLRHVSEEATLPTTFELLTLLGFLVFRDSHADYAVVEVGLGGRLDATNLVQPEVSVITPIELEHTDYLGETLTLVAREKGGIIKAGVPVVVSRQEQEVQRTLEEIAGNRNAPVLNAVDHVTVDTGPWRESGSQVLISFSDGFHVETGLRLPGAVQAANATVAALAVRTILPDVSPAALAAGLSKTWLPGRAELFPGSPPVLLDGAHTPTSINAVIRIAEELEPDRNRRILVFGAITGKMHAEMLDLLIPVFSEIVIARPGTFKPSDTGELHRICTERGGSCHKHDEMGPALQLARSWSPGLIVVTGSFHLIGEARRVLAEEEREYVRY